METFHISRVPISLRTGSCMSQLQGKYFYLFLSKLWNRKQGLKIRAEDKYKQASYPWKKIYFWKSSVLCGENLTNSRHPVYHCLCTPGVVCVFHGSRVSIAPLFKPWMSSTTPQRKWRVLILSCHDPVWSEFWLLLSSWAWLVFLILPAW